MATDPLVPVKTPFNYNLGINYETWVNGRDGRSITADLDAITKNFGLIKTFHDVANPGGANPVIDPDQQQVIKYVAQSKNLQLVMGTYTSALAKGGYGSPWSGPGSMTDPAYTDKWVQMLVTSFGSKQAVKDHLQMILLGNEVDQADNHPPDVKTYMGWFRSAFDNLSASLKKAGLGSIPVSTTIAAYTRTDAGAAVAVGATQYIYQHWSSSWNRGEPVVLFNDYTPSNEHGQFASPEFKPVIDYYKTLYAKLGSKLAPFVGETGYSSFYTLANEIKVYNQIKAWLNGQYENNGRKTIPLFIFNAFDQPAKGGLEQQFGIYADNPSTHRPIGLKPGLTLPSWSRGQINATSTDDRLYGTSGNDTLNGLAGADTMVGGTGNDTYIVENVGDAVTEAAGAGTDTVRSSLTYKLGNNVENLTLTGTGNVNGTGNTLSNVLTGNSGNNILKGGSGADTMKGGAGNDIYGVNNVGDVVSESAGQGTDTVRSTISYTLPANVENLTLTGTRNVNGTGNTLANVLTGNSGNNILKGGSGADTIEAGTGNDTLIGGAGQDTMAGGNGADTFTFGNGDSLVAQFDSIDDFVSGTDKMDLAIVGTGGLAPSAFAETSVASNSFNTIKAAAMALMAGGDKSAAFVAGMADGYLFWNTDANHTTIESGIRLAGVKTLAGFQVTDLI